MVVCRTHFTSYLSLIGKFLDIRANKFFARVVAFQPLSTAQRLEALKKPFEPLKTSKGVSPKSWCQGVGVGISAAPRPGQQVWL